MTTPDLQSLIEGASTFERETLAQRARVFATFARIAQLEKDLIAAIKAAYPNGCTVSVTVGEECFEGTVINSDACGFLLLAREGHRLPCAVPVVNDSCMVRRTL